MTRTSMIMTVYKGMRFENRLYSKTSPRALGLMFNGVMLNGVMDALSLYVCLMATALCCLRPIVLMALDSLPLISTIVGLEIKAGVPNR